MIRAGAKRLLAADGHCARVHQIAEVLPAGGRLVDGDALRRRHQIDCPGGGHAASVPGDASLRKVGNHLEVVGEDGQRIGGRHEEAAPAEDHVSVAVAVKGGAKVVVAGGELGHQVGGVRQVGVGVVSAKVLEGRAANGRGGGGAQLFHKNPLDVGAHDAVHGIDEDLSAGEEVL